MQQPTTFDTLTIDEDLFTREFETYIEEAEIRPVRITGGGKPDRIMISVEEYDRLTRQDKDAATNEVPPHSDDAESK